MQFSKIWASVSTGGIMVSKRLGQKMVEDLLVIKENGELVEEYKENCGRVFDLNDDAV